MKPYEYDFSGSCRPVNGQAYCKFNTFSVGIFQWLPGKKGLKKSPVKVRVRGYSSNPEMVYEKAREICRKFENGIYNGPRELWVSQ